MLLVMEEDTPTATAVVALQDWALAVAEEVVLEDLVREVEIHMEVPTVDLTEEVMVRVTLNLILPGGALLVGLWRKVVALEEVLEQVLLEPWPWATEMDLVVRKAVVTVTGTVTVTCLISRRQDTVVAAVMAMVGPSWVPQELLWEEVEEEVELLLVLQEEENRVPLVVVMDTFLGMEVLMDL